MFLWVRKCTSSLVVSQHTYEYIHVYLWRWWLKNLVVWQPSICRVSLNRALTFLGSCPEQADIRFILLLTFFGTNIRSYNSTAIHWDWAIRYLSSDEIAAAIELYMNVVRISSLLAGAILRLGSRFRCAAEKVSIGHSPFISTLATILDQWGQEPLLASVTID